MKNGELIKLLARFPSNYEIWIRTPDDTHTVVDFNQDHEEKAITLVTDES